MAEGGNNIPEYAEDSMIDLKTESFLSQPIGNKSVGEIPGINVAAAEKLTNRGIKKVAE